VGTEALVTKASGWLLLRWKLPLAHSASRPKRSPTLALVCEVS
jgi:hypothetical protein